MASSRPAPQPSGSLMNRTSLLILCAFSAGVIVPKMMPGPILWTLCAATGLGYLMCVAGSKWSARRKERAAMQAQKQAEWLLQKRMSRHVPRQQSPRPKFTSMVEWQQYVSVPGRD